MSEKVTLGVESKQNCVYKLLTVFQWLIMFPYLGIKNTHRVKGSGFVELLRAQKDVFYRFMERPDIKWRKALWNMSVQLWNKIHVRSDHKAENVCLIIDDTDHNKTGRTIERIGRVVSMEEYTDATNKDMCKRGIPTIKDLLYKILEMQTDFANNHKSSTETAQQIQGFGLAFRSGKVTKSIKRLWTKIPNGWYKNHYTWTGIIFSFVFIFLFAASWMKWHEYRDENRQLKTVAAKHEITSVMLNELYPELAVTIGAYEKLVVVVGVDSTLAIFNRQVKIMRKKESQTQ